MLSTSFRGFGMQSSVPRGEYLSRLELEEERGRKRVIKQLNPVYTKSNRSEVTRLNRKLQTQDLHTLYTSAQQRALNANPTNPHTCWGRGFMDLQARWLVGNSRPADAPDLEPRERFTGISKLRGPREDCLENEHPPLVNR